MKPRVVFDCMVFLQGAGRPTSPARACFRLVDEDRVTLCLSADILAEVRDVLTRPKTRRRFPLLTLEWATDFIKNAEIKAVVLPQVGKVFAFERDPKDEPYLNLAIDVQAEYLVSRDRDLLDLMENPEFRQPFPQLKILDPVAFLKEISQQNQPQPAPESADKPKDC